MSPRTKAGGIALTLAGAAAVAWFTLRPDPTAVSSSREGCCSLTDIFQNLLLFAPMGAGLALLGLRTGAVLVIAALFSGAIETSQALWIAGRNAALSDVAANTVGSLLGVVVVHRWSTRARWWRWLAPFLAVSVVLWWLVAAFVVRPMIPGPDLWSVRWGTDSLERPAFAGRVLDATFQGHPLPPGSVPEREVAGMHLSRSPSFELGATLVTGPVQPGRIPLVALIWGLAGREYMSFWVEGRRLMAYQRLNLNVNDQRGAWITLEDGLPLVADDTVHIALSARPNRLELKTEARGVVRQSSLRLSPELYLGAKLMVRNQRIDGMVWWSVIPAAASFLLLGLAFGQRRVLLTVSGTAAVLLGPALVRTAPVSWPVLLVMVLAAWAGSRIAGKLGLSRRTGTGGAASLR